MRKFFGTAWTNHQQFWIKQNIGSIIVSVVWLIAALIVHRFANTYVLSIKGTPVDDILLNLLPTLNIDFLIIQVPLLATFLALGLLLYKPSYFPFTLKALSLFILTRSFFISLTHLGASPHQLVLDESSFGFSLYDLLYNTTNDFFFSGHTGIPILLALIFWSDKLWRFIFLGIAAIFGVSVLLAHIHYSIDVFAAPFMTYSIFSLAKYIFLRSYGLIQEKPTQAE